MVNPLRERSGGSEENQIRKRKSKESSLWEEFDKDDSEQTITLSEEESELQQYLSMPRLPHTDDDPLKFWTLHETHFGCLIPLAKKMLGIPPTSAESERVFSCAGNIVVPTRTCLDPEKVKMLVFLNKNRSHI